MPPGGRDGARARVVAQERIPLTNSQHQWDLTEFGGDTCEQARANAERAPHAVERSENRRRPRCMTIRRRR